jgi:hypothetical protein
MNIEDNLLLAMLEMNGEDIPLKREAAETVILEYYAEHSPKIAALMARMDAIARMRRGTDTLLDTDMRLAVENAARDLFGIARSRPPQPRQATRFQKQLWGGKRNRDLLKVFQVR